GTRPGLVGPGSPAAPHRCWSNLSHLGHVDGTMSTNVNVGPDHPRRSPALGRTPRAQAPASIGFLPAARTSPSATRSVTVPTSSSPAGTVGPPGTTVTGVTGPSLSRSPRNVVHGPGLGMQARICRSTANAGSPQRTFASSTVTFGAWLMPSGGCGTGSRAPASIPSSTPTSSAAPERASRPRRSPAGSVALLGSGSVRSTGPVPSPPSTWNTPAPASPPPATSARCPGAAPRQAGSSEKCRLTQPYRGMSSASGGTSAPYATTGTQSGP